MMYLAPLTASSGAAAAEAIIEIATTNFNYDSELTFMSAPREESTLPAVIKRDAMFERLFISIGRGWPR